MPWARLAGPLDGAGRALTRADERLRRSPELAEGFCARAHFFDTCAAMALDGELVHLEDLVLHDAGTDKRAPTHELTRAARLLGLRRRMDRLEFSGLLSRTGIFSLIGQHQEEADQARSEEHAGSAGGGGRLEPGGETPDRDQDETDLLAELDEVLQRSEHLALGMIPPRTNRAAHFAVQPEPGSDHTPKPETRLEDWLAVVTDVKAEKLPPVLAAALLLDAWHILRPIESWPELGRFLTGAFLKGEMTPNHTPMLCAGLRKSPFRWRRQDALGTRLSALLTGFEQAGAESSRDLDRLQLARDRLMRCCANSRRHSRLPEFISLFLTRPLVTIPMARQDLGVTAAAVDHMIRQLGPAMPRELTGRNRYRAWGVL
ncbi:RHE_PE00001 family protein [Roseibium salinum]|uniref:RHE_PE00001 family protein n=2 Tax=Roseibium salinum TaxID=1604349 RepID=A0ABT3QWQ2_9HYPH|nr:RHE_PE00001 family protein [Roseibium sp. DSM 29163]MCX2721327.1 RHE_PE00001 family protein [Roseibium sp. DSM 29163]